MNFSVIIPTYNRRFYLLDSIKSILNTRNPELLYEIIIVDDGSDEPLEGLLYETFSDKKGLIRYIRQNNRGPASARNTGLLNARSDYVIFLQDDIEASPELLQEYKTTLESFMN